MNKERKNKARRMI